MGSRINDLVNCEGLTLLLVRVFRNPRGKCAAQAAPSLPDQAFSGVLHFEGRGDEQGS